MRRNLVWLSDEQWRQIELHLPKDVCGKARVDVRGQLRKVSNGRTAATGQAGSSAVRARHPSPVGAE